MSRSTLANINVRPLAAGLAVAAALLTPGCGSSREKDPETAANAFFSLIKEGKAQQAYESSAFAFQAQQDLLAFEAMTRDLGMTGYASVEWTRRVVNGKEARLDGTLLSRNGRIPVAVTMTNDDGKWRLFSLHTGNEHDVVPMENKFSLVGGVGKFNSAADRPVPSMPALKAMIVETLGKFNEAIRKKNFVDFYNYAAVAWQDQLTEKRFENAFKAFIDNGVDISGIKDAEPVFTTTPFIDSGGILILDGYFPTNPYKLLFQAQYIYEYPQWRVFGLSLNIAR